MHFTFPESLILIRFACFSNKTEKWLLHNEISIIMKHESKTKQHGHNKIKVCQITLKTQRDISLIRCIWINSNGGIVVDVLLTSLFLSAAPPWSGPNSFNSILSHSQQGIVCKISITCCSTGSEHLSWLSQPLTGCRCDDLHLGERQSLYVVEDCLKPCPQVHNAVPYVVIAHMIMSGVRGWRYVSCFAIFFLTGELIIRTSLQCKKNCLSSCNGWTSGYLVAKSSREAVGRRIMWY